jgi:hypothetical protein
MHNDAICILMTEVLKVNFRSDSIFFSIKILVKYSCYTKTMKNVINNFNETQL